MEFIVGDLVQCRDNHYNRGLGIVGAIGMVAEVRKKDIRILFDVHNQSIWVTKTSVNRITLPPTENPGLLDRLTWLIRHLEAEECELELDPQGNYRYTVVCGDLTLDVLHQVMEYLRPVFIDLKIVPRGMSRLGLEVTFERQL